MKSHSQIIFFVFIVLAITSIIQSKSLDFEAAVRVLLSNNTQVKLGRGNNPNDLPIAECTKLQDTVQLKCTISVRLTDRSNDRCKLVLPAEKDVSLVRLDTLYQLSKKKLIVIWSESREDSSLLARKITTVDIENCSNTVTLNFPEHEDDQRKLEGIILYEDGFEAFVAGKYSESTGRRERFILRYDFEGRELEKLANNEEATKYEHAVKDRKDVFTFAEEKSESSKQVIINARSGNFATLCIQKNEYDNKRFECINTYTPNQSENTREVSIPNDVKLIGVQNFRKGGFVLFGLENNSTLVAAEVRNDQQPKIQSYKLKWPVDEEVSVVLGFNEKIGSFTFAGEIKGSEHGVVLQHFDLPSSAHQHFKNLDSQ